MMTKLNDKQQKLKAQLVTFVEEHVGGSCRGKAAKNLLENWLVIKLDEHLADFTSDQEIESFIWGSNALAPSAKANKVAHDLEASMRQFRAVLKTMYELKPKDMDAFVQALHRQLTGGDQKADDLLPRVDDVGSWKAMRERLFGDLESLQGIAGRVRNHYQEQKQPRVRTPPTRRLNVKDAKSFVHACCRVHYAIRDTLKPLELNCSEAELQDLTIAVWNLYKEDEKYEVDGDALKNALRGARLSKKNP